MTNLDPTIQSSIITAIAVIATFVLTTFFNWIFNKSQRKADEQGRLFHEILQRRLALYDDVSKTLADMGRPSEQLMNMSIKEFGTKLIGDNHTLLSLICRLNIYGSTEARKVLNTPTVKLRDIMSNNLFLQVANFPEREIERDGVNSVLFAQSVNSFVLLINESLTEFAECIGKETGANFVDNKIKKILK